jgi:hypothetical protein
MSKKFKFKVTLSFYPLTYRKGKRVLNKKSQYREIFMCTSIKITEEDDMQSYVFDRGMYFTSLYAYQINKITIERLK